MRKVILGIAIVFFALVAVDFTGKTLSSILGGTYPDSSREERELNLALFSTKAEKLPISQGYGRTRFALARLLGNWHNGIDIPSPSGTSILSPAKGRVVSVGNQDLYCPKRGYGKFIVIEDEKDEFFLLFAHLSSVGARKNQKVKTDEKIGEVGRTGLATAPHLHLTVFKKEGFLIDQKTGCGPTPKGKDINPVPYLESLE